jgi:serine/threonine protein kinase
LIKSVIQKSEQYQSFLVENSQNCRLSFLKVIKNVSQRDLCLIEDIISLWQKAESTSFHIVKFYKHWYNNNDNDDDNNCNNSSDMSNKNIDLFVLQEYIQGESLSEKNRKMEKTNEKYTEKEIRKYGTELLEGLYSLQFVGFFEKVKNCDFLIKSENIYISEEGSLKIDIDFFYFLDYIINSNDFDCQNKDFKFFL